jgi:hypothetical protein
LEGFKELDHPEYALSIVIEAIRWLPRKCPFKVQTYRRVAKCMDSAAAAAEMVEEEDPVVVDERGYLGRISRHPLQCHSAFEDFDRVDHRQ